MGETVRVLLIEDEPGVARTIGDALSRRTDPQFVVRHATTLAEGLAILASAPPDVVVTDLGLPDAAGLEAIIAVRTQAPAVPIVALTGLYADGVGTEALDRGAHDYLTKGDLTDDLLARSIRFAIQRQQAELALLRTQCDLERRVEERTAELAAANSRLQEENTDRVAAEGEARAERERFASVLEHLPQRVFVKDRNSVYVLCNHAYAADLGIQPEDIAGRDDYEFHPRELADQYRADDQAVMAEGVVRDIEEDYVTGGLRRWIHTVKVPFRDARGNAVGVLGIFEDFTERKRTEEDLHESEARYRALFEDISAAVMVVRGGEFIDCNESTLRLFGCSRREEFVGRGPDEFSPPYQPDGAPSDVAAASRIGRALEEGSAQFEWVHQRLDGTPFDAEVSLSRVRVGSEVLVQAVVRDTTERKRALRALEASEARLRSVISASKDAIVAVGAGGLITMWNAAAAGMYGWEAADMLGQPLDRLMPEELRAVHARHIAEYLATGEPNVAIGRTVELPAVHRAGHLFTIELTLSPVDGIEERFVLAVIRDVSARKAAEAQRARLAAAVEQAAEAVLITDPDGAIVYANPAFEVITGWAPPEILGRTPRILKSGRHDAAFYESLWGTLLEGRTWSGHIVNRRKDGELLEEETTISPVFDDSGHIAHFVAVMRDVTGQVRLEQELRQAQKLEAIGQLAAGIAHEINTPMQFVGDNVRFLEGAWGDVGALLDHTGALLGSAECRSAAPELLNGLESASDAADLPYLRGEVPAAIEQALEGIGRVNRIVRAMKDFSHPGGETKALADLNKAVSSTVTVSRNVWKYVADLELDLDPALPPVPCVLGDINQVLLNLITNAAHAIGDVVGDGARQKGAITVTTRADSGWAEIRVADTGAGIPEAVGERVFDPFFTTKGVGKGTGQGLSLAHATITDKHRGTISFETEEGKGTVFVLRLPLASEGSGGGEEGQ